MVSNYGEIKNINGKKIKLYSRKDGYMSVSLCKNAKQKTFQVHRVVADAFVPNPDGLETVDHINGDKKDNRSENLQRMSGRDNILKYWISKGYKVENRKYIRNSGRKRGETRRIKVSQFSKDGILIETFISLMDAERKTGIGSGRISQCMNGKKPSAGGYVWRRA